MIDKEDSLLSAIKIVPQARHEDSRGFLQKILTSSQVKDQFPQGEIYVSAALPGMPKGNHYHLNMGEWFAVVQGEGILVICDPETGISTSVPLGASKPSVVYVPQGLAHAIVNTGDELMICVVAAEIEHDPDDVYQCEVWPNPVNMKDFDRS